MVLDGVHAIRIEQNQPVRGATLAELLVRELSHDARQPAGGLRGPEHGREEPMLDGPLTRPLLGLPLREVPMGAGVEEFKLGYRGPILLVQVGAPTGNSG